MKQDRLPTIGSRLLLLVMACGQKGAPEQFARLLQSHPEKVTS